MKKEGEERGGGGGGGGTEGEMHVRMEPAQAHTHTHIRRKTKKTIETPRPPPPQPPPPPTPPGLYHRPGLLADDTAELEQSLAASVPRQLCKPEPRADEGEEEALGWGAGVGVG